MRTSHHHSAGTPAAAPLPPAAAAAGLRIRLVEGGDALGILERGGLSARYACQRYGRMLVVQSDDDGVALAADAVRLVGELARDGVLSPQMRVIHRDRAGTWIELLHADGCFTGLRRSGSIAD